jgi:ubiquitin carboxyl-terminal hydrolase L5
MLSELKETVLGPDPSYGLSRADIDAAVISEVAFPEFATDLQRLREVQHQLRGRIREEQQAQRTDEDHATGRRYDYGPAVRTWLRFLARKHMLAELL